MQNFIKIFRTAQEIGPVSLFQNLDLNKASTEHKWHLAIPSARSGQYQCLYAKFYQNIPYGSIVMNNFHFFHNVDLGKTSINGK